MENISRRTFSKMIGFVSLFFVTGLSLVTEGCAAMEDIANWVPVGTKAFQSILAVLDGLVTPALYLLFEAIIGGLNAVAAAAAQYNSITPPPVGALAEVKAALGIVIDNFTQFLAGINFSGNSILAIFVEGAAELILGIISGFENALPASVSVKWGAKIVPSQVRVGTRMIAVTPRTVRKRTRRSFIHDFNKLADASNYPKAKLPESLIQHL